jgi:hypothetical protein
MTTRSLARWVVSIGLALVTLWLLTSVLAGPPIAQAVPTTTRTYPGIICPLVSRLQGCINSLSDGDTINISAGTYTESFTLDRAVNLIGADSGSTTFIALANSRVFTVTGSTIDGSVVISGFTVTGGHPTGTKISDYGGGIQITGTAAPLLSNLIISNNVAAAGGGIYVYHAGALTLTSVSLISNSAINAGAGGFLHNGIYDLDVTLIDSVFERNSGPTYAGGLYAETATIIGSRFMTNTNTSATYGGGAYIQHLKLMSDTLFSGNSTAGDGGGAYVTLEGTIVNSEFDDNSAMNRGGGLRVGGVLTLTDTNFRRNKALNTGAAYGGGLYAFSDSTILGGLFVGNEVSGTASAYGGAAYFAQDLDMAGTLLGNNTSSAVTTSRGGGVYAAATANIVGSLFAANAATGDGGGLYANNTAKLTAVNFANNSAGGAGGGVMAAADATLTNGVFMRNTATFAGGGLFVTGTLNLKGTQVETNSATFKGGGLYAAATLHITNAQFISNAAAAAGGGLYASGSNNSSVHNTLFSQNIASGDGGAMLIENSTGFILSACSLFDNAALSGGGIYLASGSVHSQLALDNNFIAANLGSAGAAEVGIGSSLSSTLTGRHNTFASKSPGSGTALLAGEDSPNDTIVLTNSIFRGYAIGAEAAPFTASIKLNGVLWSNVTTLTQGSTIQMANDLTATGPIFVSPSTRDYHILVASDAVDNGVNSGLNVDFDGEPRPARNGYDLGADEVPDVAISGLSASNNSPALVQSSIAFTATQSAGTGITYLWNFSDGGSLSSGSNPLASHVYHQYGLFTVTVTATNSLGPVMTYTVVTIKPYQLYLPLVLKNP